MMELDREYAVGLITNLNFFGIYKGESDGFYEFETTDTNNQICEGGSGYVTVPAIYTVNKQAIAILKKRYRADEVREYWTPEQNNYSFVREPVKILLTNDQAAGFKKPFFLTKEECKQYMEEHPNE